MFLFIEINYEYCICQCYLGCLKKLMHLIGCFITFVYSAVVISNQW